MHIFRGEYRHEPISKYLISVFFKPIFFVKKCLTCLLIMLLLAMDVITRHTSRVYYIVNDSRIKYQIKPS